MSKKKHRYTSDSMENWKDVQVSDISEVSNNVEPINDILIVDSNDFSITPIVVPISEIKLFVAESPKVLEIKPKKSSSERNRRLRLLK